MRGDIARLVGAVAIAATLTAWAIKINQRGNEEA